ncbi:MAG: antitoxin VapB family protein [Candidatus Lokiarchaeota archaeon]|nr:antitoxin VapB family protein [Candidatus Lokiarchaeota archaeon]
MGSKNISITQDVYDTLIKLRHGDESFSEIIMRLANGQKRDPLRFYGILSDESPEDLDIVDNSLEAAKQAATSSSSKRIKGMKV